MPHAPLKPCNHPGCRAVQPANYCAGHAAERAERLATQRNPRGRATPAARGYDGAWMKLSLAYRRAHPLCERCEAAGRVTGATMVHHRQPIETHPQLRLVWENLEALCFLCHEIIEGRITERRGRGAPGR